MKTEMYVYFEISNFKEDPKYLTKLIGVRATEVKMVGDAVGKSKLKSKFNSWQYRVDAKENFELEILVKKVLAKFRDVRGLKKAIKLGEAAIVCVLYSSDNKPSITLSKDTLKRIANLNCSFWLDYY